MRPGIRRKTVAEALAARAAPRCMAALNYRGVAYSTTQDPTGLWLWKIVPAKGQHLFEDATPSGMRPTRDSAEVAVRNAIDAQLDC